MNLETVDNWFSKLVRIKAADEHGDVCCFYCGNSFRWKDIAVGHYIKRRHMSTRFFEWNVHPMCAICNLEDELDEETHMLHAVKINQMHGQVTTEELNLLKNKEEHYGKAGLTQMGEYFRDEFKLIKKNKGL